MRSPKYSLQNPTSSPLISLPTSLAKARRGGFALILALSLMVFLALLMFTLTTLIRVESQAAEGNQQHVMARQNALLSLNLALGELQKYTGPDQRATARADISNNLSPQDGSRHWTGVWGNQAEWSQENMEPTLLNWLVSGNGETILSADTSSAETFGQILSPPANPDYTPDGALPSIGAGTSPSSDLGNWQLLMGAGTVGADPANYVVAPTLPIDAANGPASAGMYAWWIGDEGVKASLAPVDPIASRSGSERAYSFITAQRNGIERIIPDYPINSPGLGNLISFNQFASLSGEESAQGEMSLAMQEHYHSVTLLASGVQADSARGGLKKDLTAWTQNGGGMGNGDSIVPDTETIRGMPRWGRIRSYAQTVNDGSPKPPQLPTADQPGLNPVITHASLGFGTARDPSTNRLQVLFFPVFVLWNPTNVPIQGEYEIGLGFRNNMPNIRFITVDEDDNELGTYHYYLYSGGIPDPAQNRSQQAAIAYRFVTEEITIPPGRSLIFAPQTHGEDYDAGRNILSAIHSDYTANPGDPYNALVYNTRLDVDANQRTRWASTWGTTGISGNIDIVLRAPSDNEILLPYGTVLDDDYQVIQYAGFSATNSNPTVPTAPPDAYSLQPAIQAIVKMHMGLATSNTSQRWITQTDPRALQSFRRASDSNPNSNLGNVPNVIASFRVNSHEVPSEIDGRASSGFSIDFTDNPDGSPPQDFVLAEFQPTNTPLFSLAQLQHASLGTFQVQPAYAIGNSLTNPHLRRTESRRTINIRQQSEPVELFDLSWHLNRALWDQYYFSTIPTNLSQSNLEDPAYTLPNSRITFYANEDGLNATDFTNSNAIDSNAARVMTKGSFNINSTSVDAWRAVLSSLHAVAYDPKNPGAQSSPLSGQQVYPFTRYIAPMGGDAGNWEPNDTWAGYRALTGNAIDGLAQEIVNEIKKRGPFLSLADFVNRRLAEDDTPTDDGTGFGGTIQTALNTYDAERVSDNHADAINRRAPFLSHLGSNNVPGHLHEKEFWGGRTRARPYASSSAFAPGYLTQADVLTAIGSTLSARSDTFVIRAYGETRNPVTNEVTGRAWCEAIVQRVPDYINSTSSMGGDLAEIWPPLDIDNQNFGRRYKIVGFHWLNENEI